MLEDEYKSLVHSVIAFARLIRTGEGDTHRPCPCPCPRRPRRRPPSCFLLLATTFSTKPIINTQYASTASPGQRLHFSTAIDRLRPQETDPTAFYDSPFYCISTILQPKMSATIEEITDNVQDVSFDTLVGQGASGCKASPHEQPS